MKPGFRFTKASRKRDRSMTAPIEISLPFPPSVNALFANVKGVGRVKTSAYRKWAAEAGWSLAAQRPRGIAGAYEIEITAFRPDNRRRDLGNLEKGISDLLVSQGVVEDDSLAEKITLQWATGGDGVRVVVKAFEVEAA